MDWHVEFSYAPEVERTFCFVLGFQRKWEAHTQLGSLSECINVKSNQTKNTAVFGRESF